jgi:hypothetical protein
LTRPRTRTRQRTSRPPLGNEKRGIRTGVPWTSAVSVVDAGLSHEATSRRAGAVCSVAFFITGLLHVVTRCRG